MQHCIIQPRNVHLKYTFAKSYYFLLALNLIIFRQVFTHLWSSMECVRLTVW